MIAALRRGELGEKLRVLPIHRACALLSLNRSLAYRNGQSAAGRGKEQAEEQRLLRAVEAIVLAFPGYGYRRVTAQLVRDGWTINRKRVARLMRSHGLSCRIRRRWTVTTQSGHGHRVWPNLAADVVVTVPNQLWVADITYIRLPSGFCYLACILDAYSRRAIGWELSRFVDAKLALGALRKALADRCPEEGFGQRLIHHSDRGVQYACDDYVSVLLAQGIRISMSAKGTPRDNAKAESFFRTLKVEEVYLADYLSFEEALTRIERFINDVYNQKRLHSALGYVPPLEFEQMHARNLQINEQLAAQTATHVV